MTPQIFDVLDRAGHKYKRSGQWIRLKNKEFDAVSVNADSGAYRDHRTGEHGNFHALCEKLGIDSGGIYIDTRRIINSNREKTEEKQDRQRIQHAKTIYNRALPSVALNRKNGYAQAAWDRIQAEYADHREAVYDYLLSRGLDPLPLMRYIRIIPMLSDKGMDAEMQEKGADFCFIVPMYEIGKPQIPEHICGIQRTYLAFSADKYGKVRKIGRAMLGKKGVTELKFSSPNPVTLPTENEVIGAGEGFESCAGTGQRLHRNVVVCWDWSGLKAWSEAIHPAPHAPDIFIMVDNDQSGTGQRESAAAVRRIIQKNGNAVYLLPPESITPDPKGNRDWNDLLIQSPDIFAQEIIKAWHNADENLALAPVSNDKPLAQKESGPRDAEVSQAVAEAIERHAAFGVMKAAIHEYVDSYKQYLSEWAAWKKTDIEHRKARKYKEPKLPPLLLKVSTGVGKSALIRKIIEKSDLQIPILILTRTHELADEYENAGAFHYYGRSNPEHSPLDGKNFTHEDVLNAKDTLKSSDCYKHKVIEIVGEKNHIPALTACRNCEHGRKFMLEHYHPNSQPYVSAEDWFRFNHINPDQIPECKWLGHQRDALRAKIVVAVYQSYSESLAKYEIAGQDSIPRLVIVDEIPELTRHIESTTADFGLYANNCLLLIEKFTGDILHYEDQLKTPKDDEKIIMDALESAKTLKVDAEKALELMQRTGAWLGRSVGKTEKAIPDSMKTLVKSLKVDWLPGATARWERAEIKYGHEPLAPLRMMKSLMASIETDTASVESGTLHTDETTNLADRIIDGSATILLDATPSAAVEKVIKYNDGQIVHAIAKQHVNLIHFNQYLHGRTFKNKDHQEAELASLLNLREQMQQETGNMPAVLTHMPHCQLSESVEDQDWGYFGRDDVGQDRWKGRDMLIFGGPILSPISQRIKYNSDLMLMRLAGDAESKNWDSEVSRNQQITVGNKIVTSKAPLPTNPELQKWVLDDYGRRIVQAIGRSRAVWASESAPINVWIAGGLPLHGLAEHGLEVSEYRKEKLINMNDESQRRTREKVQVAVASLEAADQDASYRAVNSWLENHGQPKVRYNAWKRVIAASTPSYNESYEGVDDLLQSLFSIENSAKLGGCDLIDVARDRVNAGDSIGLVHQVAAALIVEACPSDSGDWPSPS